MKLATYYNGVAIHRRDKMIYGEFLIPHLVISTCRAAGGLQRGMGYVLNHQSCEPKDHQRDLDYRDVQGYRKSFCDLVDLPPLETVTMGTAANMNHAALCHREFRGLEVVAVVTGGVEVNGGRAGDPASIFEEEDGFISLADGEKKKEKAGTINTMVFISRPLTEAAITRVIMTATEAKTAALQELNINSRYSCGLATGTGTDQIIVAAPDPDDDSYRLTWAGKHSKLGELIGVTVKEAVKKTLARQNTITPGGQCNAKIHLERFGCSKESMLEGICGYLEADTATLLAKNFHGINRDPIVVAGVAAMVHLQDKFNYQILPASCWPEIMGAAAAQLACNVSGRYEKMKEYRDRVTESLDSDSGQPLLNLCWRALALGYGEKWDDGKKS